MNESLFALLQSKYDAYVDSFRDASGELPQMMRLKLVHTNHVVQNAIAITQGEQLDSLSSIVSKTAALLHDTGRYEQLLKYNTFRDADSVNHAKLSHDIIVEKAWLDSIQERDAVLKAVLVHNMREIPGDITDPLTLVASKVVRDADKLDIFRVLENEIENSDWKTNCKAFWNLPIYEDPSDVVVESVRRNISVPYNEIKTLADFILVQVGWIRSGLYFSTTRKLALERNHMEYRRRFLHQITSSPVVDELCVI